MSVSPYGQNDDGYWVVPRQGPGGLAPTVVGQNVGTAPADLYEPVITREMFPPGAEGDAAYAAAWEAYRGAAGNPATITTGFNPDGTPVRVQLPGGVYPNGRSGGEQALFNFGGTTDPTTAHQNIIRNTQQGSSNAADKLALHSRAQVRPEEAMQALLMADNTGQSYLSDRVQNQILYGVGHDRVNAQVEAERERLRAAGILPPLVGAPADADRPGSVNVSGPGSTTYNPNQYGNSVPGVTPAGPNVNEATGPGGPENTLGSPSSAGPDRSPPRPIPVQTTPPEVPAQTQAYAYRDDYAEGGNSVWLELTIPGTQETMNFSGDQVQLVYEQYGLKSFDEMVLSLGYDAAAWALINWVTQGPTGQPSNEPSPPTQQPERVGGGGGGDQNY